MIPGFRVNAARFGLTLLAAVSMGLLAPGCNIVAPAALLIEGPPKTDAVFELDETRPHVIFVDDANNNLRRRVLRQEITDAAQRTLLDEGVLTSQTLIDGRAALLTATSESSTEPMAISAVGRAVEADVVIYVTVDLLVLTTDGATYAPLAVARVKVMDAIEDKRLFPDDREPRGRVIELRLRKRTGSPPTSGTERAKAESDLAKELGQAVAELFYKHLRRDTDRAQ